jgi:hypothetical protein
MVKIRLEDLHYYLILAGLLVIAALLVFVADPKLSRAISVSGLLFTAAGAYWIGSGVVLRKADFENLDYAEKSGVKVQAFGRDIQKMVLPEMLRLQSKRAKWGIGAVVFGCMLQIAGAYV